MKVLEHLKEGLKSGYPLCCILHYCLDMALGKFPGYERGGIKVFGKKKYYALAQASALIISPADPPCPEEDKIYVPCFIHKILARRHDIFPYKQYKMEKFKDGWVFGDLIYVPEKEGIT